MSQTARILLLEDDHTLAELLAEMLRNEGYGVDVFDAAESVPTPARTSRYDVVVTDVHLAGDEDGHAVVKRVHAAHPLTPVIVMTAWADVDGAMNAMERGAYDYLPKPVDPAALRKMIAAALARRRVAEGPAPQPNRKPTRGAIVGSSPSMIELFKTVAQVAPTTASVLVIGESGSGKELVARAIHEKSPRAAKPFVPVNCGALTESVLETELFGHERGSFTGATAARRGLFEEADGGTLFLDEIGEISPKMQVQLLRVLEAGEIRRVGSESAVKVDVRIVAATHRDLRAEVAAGRFREDLFFRLDVVVLTVPPLRDRKSDVPALVDYFVAELAERTGKPLRVADDALATLQAYDYPGNVRELRHLLERAALLSQGGVITGDDLPPEASTTPAERSASGLDADWPTLAILDRRYIDRVLSRTSGNKTRAAEILGIDRRTLNRIFARERHARAASAHDGE
jgi:DNA-binding NtrC family response regulator